jgi:hypothetical protein
MISKGLIMLKGNMPLMKTKMVSVNCMSIPGGLLIAVAFLAETPQKYSPAKTTVIYRLF